MPGVTVEVTDQYGGYIRSQKDIVTGLINVEIFNGRTGENDEYLMDSTDPDVLRWLKTVYQPIHLDILLA